MRIERELNNSLVDPVEAGFDLIMRVVPLDAQLDLVARRPACLARHGTPRVLTPPERA